jgi:hypothetical protein
LLLPTVVVSVLFVPSESVLAFPLETALDQDWLEPKESVLEDPKLADDPELLPESWLPELKPNEELVPSECELNSL